MSANFKKSQYGFYYQHDLVKQNYISNVNRKQILETGRTNPSVYDHVLINNLYSDSGFIFGLIIVILIKVFLIRKSYFVNEKLNRHFEYEYHIINFMYCSSMLFILFLQKDLLGYLIILLSLGYLLYLYKDEIVSIIKHLNEDKSIRLDMKQIQIEEERELLNVQEMKQNEIVSSDILAYSSMGMKIIKTFLFKHLLIFSNKFFSKINVYLYILIVIGFLYILFLIIGMYLIGSNEFLIHIT